MSPTIATRALLAVFLQASAVTAATSLLFDPQTTHSNGMPLATSEPARDADLYRGCSRNHIGACGGRYQCPVMHSLARPNRCDLRRLPAPCDEEPGLPLTTEAPPVADGVETGRFELLGPAPNVLPAPGAAPARPQGPRRR